MEQGGSVTVRPRCRVLWYVKLSRGGVRPFVSAQPCVDVQDKACVDECPVDCIYEGSRSLYINPNECVDCGACEPVCPTEAIFYEDDLPDEWAWYKDAAVSFFAEVGDFGGASAHGPIGHDPEQVAALPPQNQD